MRPSLLSSGPFSVPPAVCTRSSGPLKIPLWRRAPAALGPLQSCWRLALAGPALHRAQAAQADCRVLSERQGARCLVGSPPRLDCKCYMGTAQHTLQVLYGHCTAHLASEIWALYSTPCKCAKANSCFMLLPE